jgi:signal transduction histidine kinase
MSRILIIDDDATAQETLVAMLEGGDYDLEIATNGPDGLMMADRILPDLILLDVMMPGMDGFEVCTRLRSMERLAEVPVIILTALDDRESLLRGIQSGADDFLAKPIDRQELSARVRTITRLNRYRTLLEQRENLRQMAERLVTAQEQERLRISRELHDDLGQVLTIHMLGLRNLQNDLQGVDSGLRETLQVLHDQTREISIKVRGLAQALRPPLLDTLGLVAAMEACCSEYTRRTRLPVQFEADPSIPPLPDVYNITLFRILQEALTNIVKHAEASQAWVELNVEDMVVLTVQDNGHGLARKESGGSGIGLAGMNERLTLVGGKLIFSSNPNQGTILTAQLPLPQAPVEPAAEAS